MVLTIFNRLRSGLGKLWFKLTLLIILAVLFLQKDFTFQINLCAADTSEQQSAVLAQANNSSQKKQTAQVTKMSLGENIIDAIKPTAFSKPGIKDDGTFANTYSNMTYYEKPQRKLSKKELDKLRKQQSYVKRFQRVAVAEMKKYGIPASITLAQGLVESNAGASRLARKNNNHFGMKCFSRRCKKGHCSNFTDDSHKDFFRKYKSSWESYRAHSLMLKNNKRYKKLFNIPASDYKAWCKGLKKAGYATDPHYAEKLIHVIEELELFQYD